MENERTENCFYLKHVHKYGSAKFQPNPLYKRPPKVWRKKKNKKRTTKRTKKKVGKPIGDPVIGRDAPIIINKFYLFCLCFFFLFVCLFGFFFFFFVFSFPFFFPFSLTWE